MTTRLLALFVGLGMTLSATAQLSDMTVQAIEVIGKVENGPVCSEYQLPWALIQFDLIGCSDKTINGHKILPIKKGKINPPEESDNIYDAYAAAFDKHNMAKKITLHHPDFNDCTVEFKGLIPGDTLVQGNAYKIKIGLPSGNFINARKAYNELNFRKAADLFREMVDNPSTSFEEKTVANSLLADIDSLISYLDMATHYEQLAKDKTGKERDRDLYRSRIYYNKIFKEKGLITVGKKIEYLNKKLGIERKRLNIPSLNKISISDVNFISNDLRASNNDKVPYQEDGKTYFCAMLEVDLPLSKKEVEIIPNLSMVVKQKDENDKTLLYVKTNQKDKNYDPILFRIQHPDLETFEFKLSDMKDYKTIIPEKVYSIELSVPSLLMQMANKNLASLKFEEAHALFSNNFNNDEKDYAAKCLRFLESPHIRNITNTLDEKVKDCRSTERQYFTIIVETEKDNSDTRKNTKLDEINKQLDSKAAELASIYRTIYNEALSNNLELNYAEILYKEYTDISQGRRRIPLVFDFKEVEKVEDGIYMAPTAVTSSPTVTVEFLDEKNKVIDRTEQKVTDGKISYTPSTAASSLFSQGKGKIKISTEKDLNGGKQPYKDMELEISKFKVSDYKPKRLSVSLIKK